MQTNTVKKHKKRKKLSFPQQNWMKLSESLSFDVYNMHAKAGKWVFRAPECSLRRGVTDQAAASSYGVFLIPKLLFNTLILAGRHLLVSNHKRTHMYNEMKRQPGLSTSSNLCSFHFWPIMGGGREWLFLFYQARFAPRTFHQFRLTIPNRKLITSMQYVSSLDFIKFLHFTLEIWKGVSPL